MLPQFSIYFKRRAIWLAIPLLALAAYLTALGVGFLSDDFVILSSVRSSGVDFNAFVPDPTWPFYRPVSTMLIWELGWQVWGFNPLPYHLIGLLLHAGVVAFTPIALLASGGYCCIMAIFLYEALRSLRNRPALSFLLVSLPLLICTLLTWLQLRPWHVATVQAQSLEEELLRLIPAQPRTAGMVWYAQNTPDNYFGAYIFRLGLGGIRDLTTGDEPVVLEGIG